MDVCNIKLQNGIIIRYINILPLWSIIKHYNIYAFDRILLELSVYADIVNTRVFTIYTYTTYKSILYYYNSLIGIIVVLRLILFSRCEYSLSIRCVIDVSIDFRGKKVTIVIFTK